MIFVETERARWRGEESYSCTMTTPDAGIAKVSAKSTALLMEVAAHCGDIVHREPLEPVGHDVDHVSLPLDLAVRDEK